MLCVCLSVFHPCFYWSNPVQRNNNMGLTNISCQWLINIISSQMGFPVEINLSIEKSLKLSRFKSVISVQFSYSVMSDSLAQWTAACQPSLSFANSQTLLKLKFIKSVMPSNHLTLSSPSPPAFSLVLHQGPFQWVSSLHQVAKVLEFQL